MCMKSILAPVDGAASSRVILDAAFSLANIFKSHVNILHVMADPKAAIPLLGEGMSGAMIEDMIELAENESADQRSKAHALYQEALGKYGAAESSSPMSAERVTATWLQREGREDEVIARFGRLSDIILVPKPTKDNEIYTTLALNAALFETGRPMLLLPESTNDLSLGTVSVCWNGSVEGARAVATSLPLLKKAESVHIITADTRATDTPVGDDLKSYLAWHGISSSSIFFSPAGHSVGEALMIESKKIDADIMIMGGYSHSRMRELILGGVTRDVIEQTDIPVVMGH